MEELEAVLGVTGWVVALMAALAAWSWRAAAAEWKRAYEDQGLKQARNLSIAGRVLERDGNVITKAEFTEGALTRGGWLEPLPGPMELGPPSQPVLVDNEEAVEFGRRKSAEESSGELLAALPLPPAPAPTKPPWHSWTMGQYEAVVAAHVHDDQYHWDDEMGMLCPRCPDFHDDVEMLTNDAFDPDGACCPRCGYTVRMGSSSWVEAVGDA
jgi:hypothetical protein